MPAWSAAHRSQVGSQPCHFLEPSSLVLFLVWRIERLNPRPSLFRGSFRARMTPPTHQRITDMRHRTCAVAEVEGRSVQLIAPSYDMITDRACIACLGHLGAASDARLVSFREVRAALNLTGAPPVSQPQAQRS